MSSFATAAEGSLALACAVIGGDDYQIVRVEATDVPPSDLRAAIRWRLRDVINFNVDEAAAARS